MGKLKSNPEQRTHATMQHYFEEISKHCAWIALDPHEHSSNANESLSCYLEQLEIAYSLLQQHQMSVTLLGFSLGCDASLQFLQQNPNFCHQTRNLILLDPSPPSLGRSKTCPSFSNTCQ